MVETAPPLKSLRARVISGSLVLISGSTLANGINLAYNVAVAQFLGPTGFGHVTAVYTLFTIISAVTLSFQFIAAKAVAQQPAAERKDAVYRALHRGAWACGAAIALLLVVFRGSITSYLNLPTPTLVVLLAAGVAFYVPLGARRGYVQGAFGFRRFANNLVLEGAVRLGGSLLMVYLGFGVVGVMAANAAAVAVTYLALQPPLSARGVAPAPSGYASREILQSLVFFSGQVLINNCDIVLVKHFFAPRDAGLYAAVAMVGRVIFAFSSAVVNSMSPVVAGTGHEDRKGLSVLSTSLLLVLSIGGGLAVLLLLVPASVWTTFFGAGFQLPGSHGLPYLLTLYAITTVLYSLSVVIITYEMSYKIANTSWLQMVFSGLLILGISRFHGSLQQVIEVQLVLMALLLVLVGVPFFQGAVRSASRSSNVPLRLIRPVSEEEVIAEFLKSDFEHSFYQEYRETLRPLVHAPDLEDAGENSKRRALLYLRHRSLWEELPPETSWFEAELRETDLLQLQVFPRAQWRKIARGNFGLLEVVDRLRGPQGMVRQPLMTKIASIRRGLGRQDYRAGSVVLIGVDESQPFTIIDGNHRVVAAVLEGRLERLRFLCGVSPRMTRCCWYRTNPLTLARYSRNLLWHQVRPAKAQLESLL